MLSSSSDGNTSVTGVVAIVGAIVGLYGAILSTYNAWKAHRKDRAHVRVEVASNMEVVNMPMREGMVFTTITVTNVGSRPVNITHVASSKLDSPTNSVLIDTQPPLPRLLTEGQYLTAFRDEALGGLDSVESWYAIDSTGRRYNKHIAPWYRRWLSMHRRRKAWAAKRKAKS
jgi:hypothetical protein